MGSFWAVSVWPVGLVVMGTLGWGLGGGGTSETDTPVGRSSHPRLVPIV